MNSVNSTTNQALQNRDLIEQWLVEQGYLVSHSEGKDRAWALDITDHSGLSFTASQHIARKDEIIIAAAMDIDGDTAKRFSGLKENERKSWLWDARLRLLSQDVEFDGISYPLRSVTIFQFVYRDGLTKDVFFQRLFHVRKGLQIFITLIRKRLNFPLPS
ncbi:MAG: DUF2299 family protein [Blastocatellia bacterium]|nr:DUF2299 family protein [Blastocatellia bacterium]